MVDHGIVAPVRASNVDIPSQEDEEEDEQGTIELAVGVVSMQELQLFLGQYTFFAVGVAILGERYRSFPH